MTAIIHTYFENKKKRWQLFPINQRSKKLYLFLNSISLQTL